MGSTGDDDDDFFGARAKKKKISFPKRNLVTFFLQLCLVTCSVGNTIVSLQISLFLYCQHSIFLSVKLQPVAEPFLFPVLRGMPENTALYRGWPDNPDNGTLFSVSKCVRSHPSCSSSNCSPMLALLLPLDSVQIVPWSWSSPKIWTKSLLL